MIKDYAELVTEAQRISGVSDLSARAGMLVAFAETNINKRLRTQEQEVRRPFTTDEDGNFPLSSDLVAIRDVYLGDRELDKIPLRAVEAGRTGWAVGANHIRTSEVETDLVLWGYTKLPSLEQNDTNFLLRDEPSLYLDALLSEVLVDDGRIDEGLLRGQRASAQIDALNAQDRELRFARTNVKLRPRI